MPRTKRHLSQGENIHVLLRFTAFNTEYILTQRIYFVNLFLKINGCRRIRDDLHRNVRRRNESRSRDHLRDDLRGAPEPDQERHRFPADHAAVQAGGPSPVRQNLIHTKILRFTPEDFFLFIQNRPEVPQGFPEQAAPPTAVWEAYPRPYSGQRR